jgi:hypothetical protein
MAAAPPTPYFYSPTLMAIVDTIKAPTTYAWGIDMMFILLIVCVLFLSSPFS